MLWMLFESMVLPYRNLFMVGPNKPRGLMANGMSCILELYRSSIISSPDMVMPVSRHGRALLVARPL